MAALEAPAAAQPTRTEEPPSAGPPVLKATYQHTVPGQYSDIVITISNLAEGQTVTGTVSGPKVDGDGSFSVTGGADGTGGTMVKIYKFGDYKVDIPEFDIQQTVRVVAGSPTP